MGGVGEGGFCKGKEYHYPKNLIMYKMHPHAHHTHIFNLRSFFLGHMKGDMQQNASSREVLRRFLKVIRRRFSERLLEGVSQWF